MNKTNGLVTVTKPVSEIKPGDTIVELVGGPLYQFYQTHEWCQNTQAKDKDGYICQSALDHKATQFCLIGACWRLSGGSLSKENRLQAPVIEALKNSGFGLGIAAFNDSPDMTKDKLLTFLRDNKL